MADPKTLIRVTDSARDKLSNLPREDMLTIDLDSKGCAGKSFRFGVKHCDDLTGYLVEPDSRIAVSLKASLFATGAVLDYETTPLKSGFSLKSPLATIQCGCGKSFSA